MNPLQLSQILPQSAQNTNLAFAQKNSETSFADALKAAQSELDSRENQKQAENSKSTEISRKTESLDSEFKDSEANSKVAESSDYEKKSSELSETNPERKSEKISEDEKSENKIADSDDEKSKKSDEKEIALDGKNANAVVVAENLPLENAAAENLLSSNKENFLKNQKNLEDSEKSFENGEIFESKNSKKISAAELSWLSKPGKTEKLDASNEKFADAENADDFASLIDAAIDFIPGSESEAEKLAGAQNLSISDPEAFLAKVHELADAEIGAKKGFEDEKAEPQKSKKSGVKFDVHDLRNQAELSKSAQKLALKKDANLEIASSAGKKNDAAVQLTMEMAGSAETNITSSSNQAAGANSSVFQSMLSNAVQENASDIVKAGNIVLKDNNQGSINLILKPEALGNVKISLNLNDKVISGQINVQTREALEAFKESIDALKQAFTESGFETGSFDLNFSSGQNFAQSGGNGERQSASYFAEKAYGDFVSASSADSRESGESVFSAQSSKEYSVNIVA